METLIEVCGFVGAWLLVAGPLHQAAIELGRERDRAESIRAVSFTIDPPRRVSAWWWLLPPVQIVLMRRSNEEFRHRSFAALDDESAEGMVALMNAATAWMYVAIGAALIAVKETWQLHHALDLGAWSFWLAIVVLPLACVGNVVARQTRSTRMVAVHHEGTATPD